MLIFSERFHLPVTHAVYFATSVIRYPATGFLPLVCVCPLASPFFRAVLLPGFFCFFFPLVKVSSFCPHWLQSFLVPHFFVLRHLNCRPPFFFSRVLFCCNLLDSTRCVPPPSLFALNGSARIPWVPEAFFPFFFAFALHGPSFSRARLR